MRVASLEAEKADDAFAELDAIHVAVKQASNQELPSKGICRAHNLSLYATHGAAIFRNDSQANPAVEHELEFVPAETFVAILIEHVENVVRVVTEAHAPDADVDIGAARLACLHSSGVVGNAVSSAVVVVAELNTCLIKEVVAIRSAVIEVSS